MVLGAVFNRNKREQDPNKTIQTSRLIKTDLCLVSVIIHCQKRGSEVLLGDESHMYFYEQGSMTQVRVVVCVMTPVLVTKGNSIF